MGPAWAPAVPPLPGRCRAGWPGARWRPWSTSGSPRTVPGSPRRAVLRADGTAVQGLNPLNTWVRIADKARVGAGDLYVEGAGEPAHAKRGDAWRMCSQPGEEPLYRVRRVVLAGVRGEVWEAGPGRRGAGAADGRAEPDDSRRVERAAPALEAGALDRTLDLKDIPGTAASARAVHHPQCSPRPSSRRADRVSAVGHAQSTRRGCGPARDRCARWPARVERHRADGRRPG